MRLSHPKYAMRAPTKPGEKQKTTESQQCPARKRATRWTRDIILETRTGKKITHTHPILPFWQQDAKSYPSLHLPGCHLTEGCSYYCCMLLLLIHSSVKQQPFPDSLGKEFGKRTSKTASLCSSMSRASFRKKGKRGDSRAGAGTCHVDGQLTWLSAGPQLRLLTGIPTFEFSKCIEKTSFANKA